MRSVVGLVFALLSFLPVAFAIGQNATISFLPGSNTLQLAGSGRSPQILLDQGEWPGVSRAAKDLAADFGRVTGVNGSTIWVGGLNGTYHNSTAGTIIAGSIEKSNIIRGLVKAGKIDVSEIDGQWEAFVSKVVDSPAPGIRSALVIAGSDQRGAIYGLYDVSEQIGVSPWFYWADVAPKRHSSIYALPTTKTQGSPSVKYRGIFLNDEAPALTGFINANYPPSPYGPGYNHEFYATVFELLLRLRANYMWPTTWNSMFAVDDPKNQDTATAYGIVMGTSHTEPMTRATKEWTTFGEGDWQWTTNNATLYEFFEEGAERAKGHEWIFTMGMRGVGDTALSGDIVTEELEDVVDAQREILSNVYHTNNLSTIPQLWCLYKEVQAYYEDGMRVPDDITLLWTDDNFGNIRRLPVENEYDRSGGAGVYYHFDYVGDPRDYKWINTIQLQKTWEQMYLAYERQARDIWIVNVGDLKPLEIPINHFLDLAYDITLWGPSSVPKWLALWATREFGSSQADEIADIVNIYGKLAAYRKYELVNENTYNLVNYEEADRVLFSWTDLMQRAQTVYDSLDSASQPSFFEMVLHPVLAGGTVYELYIAAGRNRMYAGQGRSSTNQVAAYVLDKFAEDHELSVRYMDLLNGKWDHMMDQTHLGYKYWQQPMRQATPPLQYIAALERGLNGDMGVAVEGSYATVPGDDMYHSLSSNTLTLPPLDPYAVPGYRWIEVFSVGTNAFSYTITSSAPFLQISQPHGSLSPDPSTTDAFSGSVAANTSATDIRIRLSIDWAAIPADETAGTITLNISSSNDYGAQFAQPSVLLPWARTAAPASFTGHVESDRTVALEAAHYARTVPGSGAGAGGHYITLPTYGLGDAAVGLSPPTLGRGAALDAATAPGLEFDVHTFTGAAAANLSLTFAPSLNADPARPLAYAVAVDAAAPRAVQFVFDGGPNYLPYNWTTAVSDARWVSNTTWDLPAGSHVLKFWALEPGVLLERVVLDLGGVRPSYLGPLESWWGGNQ